MYKFNTSKIIPTILLLGIGALIVNAFSNDDEKKKRHKDVSNALKRRKKIFISFAINDIRYRNFLVSQAKNESSPFSFVDMSVKEPWSQKIWKEKCREKIRKCDGVIVLLSKNTWHSGGSRWEIECAKEEKIPLVGMHIKKYNKGAKPPELYGKKVIDWTWNNLEEVINNF